MVIYAVNEKSSLYSNETMSGSCKRSSRKCVHVMKAIVLTTLIIMICIYPSKNYGFLKEKRNEKCSLTREQAEYFSKCPLCNFGISHQRFTTSGFFSFMAPLYFVSEKITSASIIGSKFLLLPTSITYTQ